MLKRNKILYLAISGAVAVAAVASLILAMDTGKGWLPEYTSSVADLGLGLDLQPLGGAPMVAGVVRDADKLRSSDGADDEILDLLGGIDRGYRMELCSPNALSQKANLASVYSKLKASPGQWGLLLCNVRGEKPFLFGEVERTLEEFSWGPECGIDPDQLSTIGHADHGKSTFLGTVTDVAKFNAMGLDIKGAVKGDRVHIIPQKSGGWKLALCSVKDSVLLLIDFGKMKLSLS